MKKLLFLITIVILQQITFAQSKMVDFFKKLPSDKKVGIVIKEKAGKFNAESATGKCKITVNDKNGYLQIIDDGTGGGVSYVELGLFKNEKGEQILAYNSYIKSADGIESEGILFYNLPKYTTNDMVWPDMGNIEDLLPTGVTKGDIETYKDTEYGYSILPQNGTTILYNVGFKNLDEAVTNGDTKAKKLKEKLKPAKLVWNKKNSAFELK